MPEQNWTLIGAEHIGHTRLESGRQLTRPVVQRAIDGLDWVDVVDGLELPMMPGLAIKTAISELNIPKPSKVAVSHELAPYGFVAIEGNYSNGRARVYVLDLGSTLVPLRSDFWDKEAA